jgi:hypothetical protein
MKYPYFFVGWFLVACLQQSNAQGVKSLLDRDVNPGEILMEFDNRNREIIGNYYIDEDWNKGNIELKSGIIIKNQLIRYDLEYDLLEVKLPDELKVIPLHKMNYFWIIDWIDSNLFLNCDSYSFEDGTPLSGICRVIEKSTYGAIIKYSYDIKDATYVPALDMGTKDDEILIKKHIFLTKNEMIYKLPGNRKDFYSFFMNPNTDIKSFMKQNKLNHKDPEDLSRILKYINQYYRP